MSYLHRRGFPKEEKNPHECLAWAPNELVPLSAFQVSVSDRTRSSSKQPLAARVQIKGPKPSTDSLYSELFAAPASFLHVGSQSPCPALQTMGSWQRAGAVFVWLMVLHSLCAHQELPPPFPLLCSPLPEPSTPSHRGWIFTGTALCQQRLLSVPVGTGSHLCY